MRISLPLFIFLFLFSAFGQSKSAQVVSAEKPTPPKETPQQTIDRILSKTPENLKATVTVLEANVRHDPKPDSSILGTVKLGQALIIKYGTGVNDVWFLIAFNKGEGWISSDDFSFDGYVIDAKSPLEELSKLELTPDEIKIDNNPIAQQQYQYIIVPRTPRVTSEYDKFKDKTFVRSEIFYAWPEGRSKDADVHIRVATGFAYAGKKLNINIARFYISIISHSDSWLFLQNHSLILFVDAKRIRLGIGYHSGEILSHGVGEVIDYWIDRKDLATIANAKTVEMQIGGVELQMSYDFNTYLKDTLAAGTVKK